MLTLNHKFNREISIDIPISQKLSEKKKLNSPSNEEYSLNQGFFDPSKSSPPNEFMIKLHMRLNRYHSDNNVNSFDTE